jgi:hypothetical protein
VIDNFLSKDVRLESGIGIEGADLGKLTGKLLPVPVIGTFGGELSPITLAGGEWKAGGTLRAATFGGKIEASHIFARDLFSAGRAFGGDVVFYGIDLRELTNEIEIGRITGIVRGSICDLVFRHGRPAHFVFTVETDATREEPRTVSVDAIENLSIVSTGSAAVSSILNSGINRFFKQYPYSRIGIRCTLEDDVFRLRGTIIEGGTEYLVRRGFLRGIDVVNRNPENFINFTDMQERLGRVTRTPAQTEDAS